MSEIPANQSPSSRRSIASRSIPLVLRNCVERGYLSELPQLGWRVRDISVIDQLTKIRIAKLEEMATFPEIYPGLPILASLSASQVGAIFIISGGQGGASIYMGVYPRGDNAPSCEDSFKLLSKSINVNLPGSRLGPELKIDEMHDVILRQLDEFDILTCVTGVPTINPNINTGYETLIDGLQGYRYMLFIVSQPIDKISIQDTLTRIRELSSQVHSFVRISTNQALQRQIGTSQSTSLSYGNINPLLFALMGSFSPMHFLGNSASVDESNTLSESETSSIGQNFEQLDKEFAQVENLLDAFADRLETGKRLGLWNTGVYLFTHQRTAATLGQGYLHGIYAGDNNRSEPYRAFPLTRWIDDIRTNLSQFRIPAISWNDGSEHLLGRSFDELSTLQTSAEFARLFQPPQRQVPGLPILPLAQFNINPPKFESAINIGQVIHLGQKTEKWAHIRLEDLTRHAFVTGVTGAGKTNTCLLLLSSIANAGIPFLVIEPAKHEYSQLKYMPGINPPCHVYTLGDETDSPLRLNPFQFVPGFPLLTHIDFLKAIFNASFPMYASMPYILEEAILGVYEDWGWDVTTGENRYATGEKSQNFLPTLEDLYDRIDVVVAEKRYAERLTMDITAALKTRIKSLFVGGKGKLLNSRYSDSLVDLFSKSVVLQLRRIGNDEEKCFIIALLLVWLYEHCETRQIGKGLQHLTLLEEAHRILQNVPPATNEMIGTRNQAVNTFSNMLAEIRAYGEGLVIVDQIPAKLAPDIVKNTDLKILHRLVAADDREFVGQAMTLTPEQNEYVARLRVGEAVVYYEAARTPMLLQFDCVEIPRKFQIQGDRRFELLRQGTVCVECQSPCMYGPLTSTDIELTEHARWVISSLLIEPSRYWFQYWQDLVKFAYLQFRAHNKTSDDWKGQIYCSIAGVMDKALVDLFEFQAIVHHSALTIARCKIEAMQVIKLIISNEPDKAFEKLEILAELLITHVAQEPGNPLPGCDLCQMHCRFGFWVAYCQSSRRPIVEKDLTAIIPKTPFSERRQTTFNVIQIHYPEVRALSPHFAHCVLTRLPLAKKNLEYLKLFKNI